PESKSPLDRRLENTGCLAKTRAVVTLTEPIEHQGRGEERGERAGLALAGDVGRGAVRRLKETMRVADLGAGGHAHAADESAPEVRQDVPEHVLHDEHVELPWPPYEIERHGIDVGAIRRDVRVQCGTLQEDLAEEGVGAKHVRLV